MDPNHRQWSFNSNYVSANLNNSNSLTSSGIGMKAPPSPSTHRPLAMSSSFTDRDSSLASNLSSSSPNEPMNHSDCFNQSNFMPHISPLANHVTTNGTQTASKTTNAYTPPPNTQNSSGAGFPHNPPPSEPPPPPMNVNQRVRLNVGGKMFETLLATLQKAGEDSNLATVAREAAEKDLPMFIDRDPDTFAILLNFLRTGQLLVPSWADSSTIQLLRLDASFYGVHNSAYLHFLESYSVDNRANYSLSMTIIVPEMVSNEIKGMETSKRREYETKWLSWYKEDTLSFAKVFRANSISSFTAQFLNTSALRMAFVVWGTECSKEKITSNIKDFSKLHLIEEFEITEI